LVKNTDHGEIIMSKDAETNLNSIILRPYITEKTFNLIEKENKLTFIVSDSASKKDVNEAIETMYEGNVKEVNIFRTIQGKKAIVKFTKDDEARQLATKLGLV
jgi:large subunit ribosomal protein L23